MKKPEYKYLHPGDVIRSDDQIRRRPGEWWEIKEYLPEMIGKQYYDGMKKMRRGTP